MNYIKQSASATWVAVTSLTLAQFNALLGTTSLVLGISYQLWRWRHEAVKQPKACKSTKADKE